MIAMSYDDASVDVDVDGTAYTSWEERLRSLPTIAKSTGTAMFLNTTVKTTKLGSWVKQRSNTSCT
jgi:hypothetical protein